MPHQPLTLEIGAGHRDGEATGNQLENSAADPDESPITSKTLEQACDWLANSFAGLLEEQLGMIVESQDAIKKQLLQAIAGELPGKKRSQKDKPSPNLGTGDAGETPLPSSPATSVIDPGDSAALAATADRRRSSLRQWQPGDAVEFTVDGRQVWGEIVGLDDAASHGVADSV